MGSGRYFMSRCLPHETPSLWGCLVENSSGRLSWILFFVFWNPPPHPTTPQPHPGGETESPRSGWAGGGFGDTC